jgi:aconitate hydratase
MGILPLNFLDGESAQSLGLTGKEIYDIEELTIHNSRNITVVATAEDGNITRFHAKVRIDTPKEWEYYQHGGILHYVLRQLAA